MQVLFGIDRNMDVSIQGQYEEVEEVVHKRSSRKHQKQRREEKQETKQAIWLKHKRKQKRH